MKYVEINLEKAGDSFSGRVSYPSLYAEREDTVEWELRHGDPNKVRWEAAAIVSAYRALVWESQRNRNKICNALRKNPYGGKE